MPHKGSLKQSGTKKMGNKPTKRLTRDEEITVAQMAAFFLSKEKNKAMAHLKLIKLLYLSDREMIKQYGYPMSWDTPISLEYGPALSQSLDLMRGKIVSAPNGWDCWIAKGKAKQVVLKDNGCANKSNFIESLDHFSVAMLQVLEEIWKKFGSMTTTEISDWTHDPQYCQEWSNPGKGVKPIQFEAIAEAVGFDKKTAKEIADSIKETQAIHRTFAS